MIYPILPSDSLVSLHFALWSLGSGEFYGMSSMRRMLICKTEGNLRDLWTGEWSCDTKVGTRSLQSFKALLGVWYFMTSLVIQPTSIDWCFCISAWMILMHRRCSLCLTRNFFFSLSLSDKSRIHVKSLLTNHTSLKLPVSIIIISWRVTYLVEEWKKFINYN